MALVNRYGALIRKVVCKVCGPSSRKVGEDIEQRVFVGLWNQVRREQIIEHPSSYVYRAAVRETVRAMREEQRRQAEPIPESVAAGEGSAPDVALARQELGRQIEACLSRLRPEREQAVRAHLVGFDIEEIMKMQGWPYQKARNLVARGVADLRRLLQEQGVHA